MAHRQQQGCVMARQLGSLDLRFRRWVADGTGGRLAEAAPATLGYVIARLGYVIERKGHGVRFVKIWLLVPVRHGFFPAESAPFRDHEEDIPSVADV
jgi:hypothetical protein